MAATLVKDAITLTLDNKEAFIGGRKFNRQQAKGLNQLGQVRAYNLGSDFFNITIKLDLLSDADKTNIVNFIVNTTDWAQNTFTFTDERSNVFPNCRFWFDQVSINKAAPERSTGRLIIRQDPT